VSGKPAALQQWLEAFQEAAPDVAAMSLRFAGSFVPAPSGHPADRGQGAYVAILGETASMHLGVSTTAEGVQTLARALLGIRGGAALGEKDAADAMCEILNILAGKVKSRMAGQDGALRLGLPMFIRGEIQPQVGMECAEAVIQLGPVPCRIYVYRHARAERRAA
jgi:hypothetical protein